MISFKNKLKEYIFQRGEVTVNELENLARTENRKISNMERRMREIVEDGKIAPIKNKKGIVIGYEVFEYKRATESILTPNLGLFNTN